MIETIDYDMYRYPAFQAKGNAAKFIMPFALEVCEGVGYDIGCNRLEWLMPGAIPIDPGFGEDLHTQKRQLRNGYDVYGFSRFANDDDEIVVWKEEYHATNLPRGRFGEVDFIFSSHCLEHVKEPWFDVLEYWVKNIKHKGVLFLYLPDYSQRYWRPWNNRKHVHILTPEILSDAFHALGITNVFVSGVDFMNSFAIMGEVNHEE